MIKLKKSDKGYFITFTNWKSYFNPKKSTVIPVENRELRALYLLLHKHYNK